MAVSLLFGTAGSAIPKENTNIESLLQRPEPENISRPTEPRALELVNTTKMSYSNSELSCLAKNIYYESRSEPRLGKYAVANVTMNRVADSRFPNSVCSVVYQPSQFSWVNSARRRSEPAPSAAWEECKRIATEVLNGKRLHGFNRVLFFHAAYVSPGWRHTRAHRIGNHIFYRG